MQRQFAASDSVASRGFSRLGVWSNFGSEAPGALSERKGLTPLAEASGEVASLFEQRQRKALEAEEASGVRLSFAQPLQCIVVDVVLRASERVSDPET